MAELDKGRSWDCTMGVPNPSKTPYAQTLLRSPTTLERKPMENNNTCYKCGGKIAFKKLPNGKWCPTEPDGSDHWDACKQRRNPNAPTISTNNKITNPQKRTKFYSDPDIPPWDESLGEFQEL